MMAGELQEASFYSTENDHTFYSMHSGKLHSLQEQEYY